MWRTRWPLPRPRLTCSTPSRTRKCWTQHPLHSAACLSTSAFRGSGAVAGTRWLDRASAKFPARRTDGLGSNWSSIAFRVTLSSSALRPFSSTGGGRGGGSDGGHRFKLDALPFTVSPEEALAQFDAWATEEQGLRYLLSQGSVRIGASYVPVWSFDVNVRFVTAGGRLDAKPEPFEAYKADTVHLPGLAAYAGHTYRRSLVNPIHNTSLVFLGKETVPFGPWMLRGMKMLSTGERLDVFPDPWNATRGRAFAVVEEELNALAEEDSSRIGPCEVHTQILSSRRVYMPTFVIEYKVLGMEYKAFVSGCDAGSGVSGVDHRAWSFRNRSLQVASNSFLGQVRHAARQGRRMFGDGILILGAQALFNLAVRVLARIHIVGLVGGAFVGFRKIVKPWMDDRTASADWERQREHEAFMRDHWDRVDDFVDDGSAERYFRRNRTRILRRLSGETDHSQGDFDWYKDWEEWARRQWEKQQREAQEQWQQAQGRQTQWGQSQQQQQQYQQQRQREQQQQQQRARRPEEKKKKEYHWDFNPSDPYSVLGIKRGASKSEVSAAFRREMLKHHPDVQAGASEAEKERSVERSKLITEAYRKIKAQTK